MRMCPYALTLQRVPSKKWVTRAELLARLELARQMLEQTYALDHKVADLASIAAISPAHFCRLFRETYGTSPQKYRSGIRLDRAREMILRSDQAIGDVTLAVGYTSSPSFSRQFRERFGVSPREARESLR